MSQVELSGNPHTHYPDSAGVEVTVQAAEQFAEQIGSHLQFGVVGDRQFLHRHRGGGFGDFPAAGGVDHLPLKLGQVGQHG
ncbi:hypothetical protein [Amycolatopsis balhimycina]|uniref:hypothetical protein n=1 Tax=Amycolatopsis balhimycina TaxID=208443 RepID=UPI0003628BC3|nr:hypothetical protein [Amycolatopsis balhimycina]